MVEAPRGNVALGAALGYRGPVKALRAVLQTFGVLLGIWVALAIVGIATGAIPGLPWSQREATDAPVADVDAGMADDAGVDAIALDAGTAEIIAEVIVDGGPPPLPRIHRDRWVVCAEPAMAPSLAAVDLVGDARAELVVGCGDHWEVLAVSGSVPSRVSRIDAPIVDAEGAPGTGPAIAVDFDGDGARDLVLPFASYGAGGATRGGGLYVVPRDRFGGFDAPRALAPIAALAVAAGAIDGDATSDLAVLNLANPFARLPSEAWVFLGGASPARRSVLRTGPAATAIALVDLDRDEKLDVVVATSDEARVDVFFGDGTGVFPRHHTLSIAGAAGLTTGDVDGDGGVDVIVEAAGAIVVRARERDELETTRVETIPGTIRGLRAMDLDGDGRAELVGWDHPRLVVTSVGAEPAELRTLLELGAGDFGPRRHELVDLDGDGARELVLLGVSAIDGERQLELVVVPGNERGVIDVGDRRAVEDAPLMLRVPLPDAQAP